MRVTLVTLGDLGRCRNLRTTQAQALRAPWEASGELSQVIARDVTGAVIRAVEVRAALPGGRLVLQGLHALDRLGFLRTHDTILRLFDAWAARALHPSDVVLLHPFPLPKTAARAGALGALVVGWGATAHPAFMARAYAAERKRQGLDGSGAPPHAYAGLAAALSSLDVLLVPSRFAAQTYWAEGFSKDRLVIVTPGIDTERFSPPPTPVPSRPLRVVSVAHWTLLKGLLDLLDAWERAAPANAVLEIVGSRDFEVRTLLRRRRIPATVLFLGSTDPRPAYHRAHLFVLPSLSEGSARTVGEAAASGLPL
ncbi:MAG: glycosyltransferase, partial [bacterium]|nr:glycosyltransferase [bacterium]